MSKDQWKRQKNKLLENLSYYCAYEVEYIGKKINYKVIEILGNYQPLEKKSAKRNETYEQGIIRVIEDDNIQTAANVARRLSKEDAAVQSFNHSSGTVYEYTRTRMRNMFGVKVNEGGSQGMITGKVWCRLDKDNNCYIPLSEESIQKFYDIYSLSQEARKEYELEVFSDYQNGLITREEAFESIGERAIEAFKAAREKFKQDYGYYPIKVPVYEVSAFEREE